MQGLGKCRQKIKDQFSALSSAWNCAALASTTLRLMASVTLALFPPIVPRTSWYSRVETPAVRCRTGAGRGLGPGAASHRRGSSPRLACCAAIAGFVLTSRLASARCLIAIVVSNLSARRRDCARRATRGSRPESAPALMADLVDHGLHYVAGTLNQVDDAK
jgi:hypothetical protein